MPHRGAPPSRVSAGNLRRLANQIAEQLNRERKAQIAQADDAASSESTGPTIAKNWARIYDYMPVFAYWEGARSNRSLKDDPGGLTLYGVTQIALDDWRAKHPDIPTAGDGSMPENVSDLTPENARIIHLGRSWDQYNLHRIKDDGVAFQIFDIMGPTGAHGVAKIVYPTIDEVLRRHGQRFSGLVPPKTGGIDQNAIDRINAIDEAGLTRDLQEALVNRRLNYFKRLDNFDANPGWVTRAEYFRPGSRPRESWRQ
jgi:lysozyme family protein